MRGKLLAIAGASRASSGQLKLQTVEVDLSTLIRQVTANMLRWPTEPAAKFELPSKAG